MSTKFRRLTEQLAQNVQDDYDEAHNHAVLGDAQRAGHGGEATWVGLLRRWLPGWPVVTRKYIVGPGGSTNEIDIVILKKDYPVHLGEEPEILASGVAAAFSCKLTFKKQDIAEAVQQKKALMRVLGLVDYPAVSVRAEGAEEVWPIEQPPAFSSFEPETVAEELRGPVPFALLSHSTKLFQDGEDFRMSMQELYAEVAHHDPDPVVQHPRDELDALIVANEAFFSMAQ